MRVFTFILALYTLYTFILALVLSIMPCGDDMVVSYNNEHSISHVEDSSHNHDSESDDGCTPFCICQCCGTSIDLPLYSLIYSKKKAKNSQHYPNYISNYSFDFKGGVWHPPSIG